VQDMDIDKAKRLLETDLLRNIVTLKMINSFSSSMTLKLLERKQKWALLSLLPTEMSEWDKKRYPNAKHIAFLDGNDLGYKRRLWREMPRTEIVFKTGDPDLKEVLRRTPRVSKVDSFVSFTKRTNLLIASKDTEVKRSDQLTPQVEELIKENGYESEELNRCFANGAEWFGIENDGQIVSACFVYQNYGSVWEIAGVYTVPLFRKLGLAKRTVVASLYHLQLCGFIPRYQVRWNNGPSIQLALSIGLEEFLRFDHFLMGTDEQGRAT
jgi:hypothetical protein